VVGFVPRDPSEITPEVPRTIRRHGFVGATVPLPVPLEADPDVLRRAGDVMRAGGVEVVQCNPQYEMLVHPDDETRRLGIRQLRAAARCARLLGAHNTYVRPGSLDPAGPWLPHSENTHPRTIERLVASLREVVKAAEDEGVPYAIEGAQCSPLDTPDRVREVIEAVGSPMLRFNADPVNFVGSLAQAYDNARVTEHLFDVLGDRIACAHVKDIAVVGQLTVRLEEVPLGEGVFDQVTFARRFQAAAPDRFFMLEHLGDDQYPAAKANLDRLLAAAGIGWSA
jgi:sugar phosphate isomerase/epimerase